jgi:hypothetical protein
MKYSRKSTNSSREFMPKHQVSQLSSQSLQPVGTTAQL